MKPELIKPEATSTLPMWLHYLENIHSSAIDLGLERVSKVALDADLIKPAPFVITVAGTNGKGSTCAMIESILMDAGYRVGVYSSPHLIHYNERIRIQSKPVSDEVICDAFSQIESKREQTSLSFFEFGTLAALQVFKQNQLDVVILEVGLGGRLDATNIVEHDVSVITSLALDHTDWLGSDLNVIGYEKAGIFRTNKPAVCGQPNAPATVAGHADDIGAKLYQVGYQYQYHVNEDAQSWHWQAGAFDLPDLPIPHLPLMNAATALMAIGVSGLQVTDLNIVEGLKNAQLAGRMQQIHDAPCVILDVAHNPHAAKYLVSQLQLKFKHQKIAAVVGMLHDKDIESTLKELNKSVETFYLADLKGPRAAKSNELAQYISQDKIAIQATSPVIATQQALLDIKPQDVLLIVGSFHTVGEVLEHWHTFDLRKANGE